MQQYSRVVCTLVDHFPNQLLFFFPFLKTCASLHFRQSLYYQSKHTQLNKSCRAFHNWCFVWICVQRCGQGSLLNALVLTARPLGKKYIYKHKSMSEEKKVGNDTFHRKVPIAHNIKADCQRAKIRTMSVASNTYGLTIIIKAGALTGSRQKCRTDEKPSSEPGPRARTAQRSGLQRW